MERIRPVLGAAPELALGTPASGARAVTPLSPGDRVVIVGAGPAGLTAAYQLAKDGEARITVLEADNIVGGLSRTARYKGFRFDIGGHRFFTKIGPVEALWHEILGKEFISVPRLSRIHYNGRFFDYPLKAGNALRGLGPLNALLIFLSYVKWHYRPYPVEENFEQWVTNRFGKRLYEIFFKTYTEKVWGIPCTEIRAEWAAQRIQGLSLAKAILTATTITRRSTNIKTLIHEFQYPRLGPGQMWEMCRDRVTERGHDVLLNHYVDRIHLRNGRVAAITAKSPAGERTFEAEHFITTMPVRSLVRALTPAPPAAVREAAEGLRYRDFLVVALMLKRDNLFPDNWIYIHTPGVKVGRIQNFNNWSAALVPTPGMTCLGLEYFCFKGDGLWDSKDEDLVAQAGRELETLGLARQADIVDGCVIRMPKAYPIYDAAYRAHLEHIRTFIDPIPNLHTVGRNGMHKYNNQDHSMLAAMMAVWNMQGAAHDIWDVNTDFEYHEEQKLEPPARRRAASA
jgi:protoporphyrinogen oxidase